MVLFIGLEAKIDDDKGKRALIFLWIEVVMDGSDPEIRKTNIDQIKLSLVLFFYN